MGKYSLSLMWDKRQKDFLIRFPRKCDGALLHSVICSKRPEINFDENRTYPISFSDSLIEELDKRGYDTKTLYLKVMMKREKAAAKQRTTNAV